MTATTTSAVLVPATTLPRPLRAKRIALPTGVTLPYVSSGSSTGVPVVLLHGVIDSWQSFATVLPHLPASIRAFALTQRGHGEADRPAAGYGMGDFAADVAAFVDALGLDRVILVGHSMGATVAQRFALDFPERTRGLVLIGSFASFARNPNLVEFHRTTVAPLTDPVPLAVVREFQESTLAGPIDPAFLARMIDEGTRPPARVWRAAFDGMLADEHVARLDRIAAPTLALWGERDNFVPRRDQDALLAAMPRAELAIYRGIGHAVHWEAPARVAADIALLAARS